MIDQFARNFSDELNRALSGDIETLLKSQQNHTQARRTFDSTLTEKTESMESISEGIISDVSDDGATQDSIRGPFGKQGRNLSIIGGHPDFLHLEGGGTQRRYVCSMFVDIKNSTRLSFLYDLDDVFKIKNTIIRFVIEAVRAMDGHVHRLMGDAVLAFFGSSDDEKKENCIIDAINCAAFLENFMVYNIVPALESAGFNGAHIGFRIGLDFGDNEEVLWSSYGLPGVNEITATSFHVDSAAKLQSMAAKNRSMLGNSLIEKIDFPSCYIENRERTIDGKKEEDKYLLKSYTDASGTTNKYRVWQLRGEMYRRLFPFPLSSRAKLDNSNFLIDYHGIYFECLEDQGGDKTPYKSCSRALEKECKLNFTITISTNPNLLYKAPLTANIYIQNHGKEASEAGETARRPANMKKEYGKIELNDMHSTRKGVTNANEIKIEAIENTKFRGLHTAEAVVKDKTGTTIFRDMIGVYIE